MPVINKSDVRKQDFIIVKEKNSLDIAKIVAPHEMQIGIDGFKGSSLRVAGNEYIAGSLEVTGGVKGALRLPDGTLAVRAGSGIRVIESENGSVTISLSSGSSGGGAETIVRAGTGLSSSISDGVVTLSLSHEITPPTFAEGPGIKISRHSNLYTLSIDTGSLPPMSGTQVTAGDGLLGSMVDGKLSLSLDRSGLAILNAPATFSGNLVALGGLSGSLTTLADGSTPYLAAGAGIQITTGSNGQVQISSIPGGTAGSVGTELVMNASVAGPQDGANLNFTLDSAPADAGSFMLWLNGQLLDQGSDYVLNGQLVRFSDSNPPVESDVIRVMYSRRVSSKLYAISVSPSQLVIPGSADLSGVILPNDPDPQSSLMLFLNGQLLTQGSDFDYSLNGRNVLFSKALRSDDIIRATYSYVA